jgi:hypothetical protein
MAKPENSNKSMPANTNEDGLGRPQRFTKPLLYR